MAAAAVILGPFLALSYYILIHFIRLSESFSDVKLVTGILLSIGVLFYYFFLVALALANTPSWKKFARRWFFFSFQNAAKTAPIFALNLAVLSLSSLALYAAVNYGQSALLLLGTGIVEIAALVLTRIFWTASIYELQNEAHHH